MFKTTFNYQVSRILNKLHINFGHISREQAMAKKDHISAPPRQDL